MQKKGFVYLFFLILLVNAVNATDYYVDKNSIGGSCSDSNVGSITEPWCSISEANSRLEAGDTVYIREGTYQETIRPGRSGSEGKYITYANYDNEEVMIKHVSTGINLDDRSYIKITGLKIEGTQVLADCCAEETIDYDCYDMRYWIRMEDSSYNIISNNELRNAAAWAGIRMTGVAQHNKIINNKIIGGYGPADLIYCTKHCSDNLIEGNELIKGAHGSICLNCAGMSQSDRNYRNIIRNNIVYNPWHTGINIDANSDYAIVENNLILDCGEDHKNNCRGQSRDRNAARIHHNGIQLASSNVIIRNNTIINAGGGIAFGSYIEEGTILYFRYNRIYNNVLYQSYRGLHSNSDPPSWAIDNFFKNNIIFDSREYDLYSELWADDNDPEQGSERFFFNNIFHGALLSYQIKTYTLDELETKFLEYFQNNINIDPAVVDKLNNDFHLIAESPAIDKGDFLTKTTGKGSGNKIPVIRANYFTDGFGIIEGDLIQLENQTERYQIIDINYDTNEITVDRNLEWEENQGVSLAYEGDAPDIGAYEFQQSTLIGDVDLDNDVDLTDLILVAIIFSKTSSEPEFNPNADFNSNDIIDLPDLITVAIHFGESI